ncbi:MAG: serine/threonine protein kinase [Planctomycetaceae bacterium]|nr:serine/threonine protein kinase [Planctomycetaceae bacterium]
MVKCKNPTKTCLLMNSIPVSVFLDCLRRSELVEDSQLGEILPQIREELGPEKQDDSEAVGNALVTHGLITPWHLRQLLKKRYKGFFLRQYKILSHLGTGGMSTVYLAEHTMMHRQAAIKVLPKKKLEKSIYLDRFVREAQAIASLDHPNIIRAYDIDRENHIHYIVMEYFKGRNLQEVVDKDGVLAYETAADYVRQAALALEYAHQIGVVHRDVKPGNLLVNHEGLVKVLDLGLALLDEGMFDGKLTEIQEDRILGTADYLAPEQGIDSHQVDARADIYGLGCVLYFCLTGHAPFPEGGVAQKLLDHQHKEPAPIFRERPDAPEDLVRLCQKMMSKKREDRQQSAMEVVADLQNWLITHGFADKNTFPSTETFRAVPATLGAVPIASQAERLKKLAQSDPWAIDLDDTESGSDMIRIGDESRAGLLSGTDSASSGMTRWGESPDEEKILTSSKSNAFDPLRIALHEIGYSDTEKTEATKELKPSQTPEIPPDTPSLLPAEHSGRKIREDKTADAETAVPFVPSLPPWYKLVPLWFWCVFAGTVFTAIFLTGVLAALLTRTR